MRPYADSPDQIRVTCPACLKRGKVSCRYAGREVRCRRCQECFDVPAGESCLGVSWPVAEPADAAPAAGPRRLGVARQDRETRTLGLLKLFQG